MNVLPYPIIEAIWLPCFGEKNQRNSLTEVVQLQTTSSYSIHDGCIMNNTCGNFESSCTEDDIRMCCCTSVHMLSTVCPATNKNSARTQMDHRQQGGIHLPFQHYLISHHLRFRPYHDRRESSLSHRKLPYDIVNRTSI